MPSVSPCLRFGLLFLGASSLALAVIQDPSRVPGIQKAYFDPAVKPGDDFYRYANGKWLAETPVPADESSIGSFSDLTDGVEEHLKKILEERLASNAAKGSEAQQIGDFYRAYLDEARLEELRAKPLAAELAAIDALARLEDLPALLARLAKSGVSIFRHRVGPDAKDSSRYVVMLAQGGLGLPDRDYYLSDDEKLASVRGTYQEHIARMLQLLGASDAGEQAEAILDLETQLAQKSWTRVESRDAVKTYNFHDRAALQALTPAFDWTPFLGALGYDKAPGYVVSQPSFFGDWAKLLQQTPLATLKAYLRWNLLSDAAPLLSADFAAESFAFRETTLNGVSQMDPRWKRGVAATQAALGEVLGKLYVERHFPPVAKARMETLVQNLIKAYGASIAELDWMSEETKRKALEKLAKFRPKIGYPSRWKDYSSLVVDAQDLFGNVRRARAWQLERQAAKLGQPIDREEWFMTPQTVNAYYSPVGNEIVFPAAILQPPFFDLEADDAVNYGGIGAVIGHEIGHGFDDQGSRYDGDGNLRSWWTDEDRQRFETRTKALIAQYGEFEALPGRKVNGALTIGENIGDLGGLSIAYRAWQMSLDGKEAPVIDGLSGAQRFFLSYAQIWRRNYQEENLLQRLKSDPHSPSEFRCNGIVRNFGPWYETFGVPAGSKLYLAPEERVKIW
ncbi:MAG: M13 family metallopeptidase [Planctomycetes bacterium]|nr:M13 family metallopeptidase [Planctomycetota bacterium]